MKSLSARKNAFMREANWLAPRFLTSQVLELLKINLCCLSHPINDVLLGQPELTDIITFTMMLMFTINF